MQFVNAKLRCAFAVNRPDLANDPAPMRMRDIDHRFHDGGGDPLRHNQRVGLFLDDHPLRHIGGFARAS